MAEIRQETNFLSNKEKVQCINDYKERETAVARKQVEDAETASKQEQDDIRSGENGELTSRKAEQTLTEMLNVIGLSLSDLASSDDEEDQKGENYNEDTYQCSVANELR